MNHSPAFLKLVSDVSEQEAAVAQIRLLDSIVAAGSAAFGGKGSDKSYVNSRQELLRRAGV